MTDAQYVTLRNLLWAVIGLLLVSVGANIYVGRKLEENSRVFGKMYALLESGLGEQFASAMVQASAIEQELVRVRQQAEGVSSALQGADSQMKKTLSEAENNLVQRVNRELPPLMDRYIESRTAQLRRWTTREEATKLIREEISQIVREELRKKPPQP